MGTTFNENFLEDNFLSNDDWDVKEESSCPWDDTSSLLQNSASYMQQESDNAFLESEIYGLINGLESPPLTPPEEKVEVISDLSVDMHGDHFNNATNCTELLTCVKDKSTPERRTRHVKNAQTSRYRSGSDASSSSTSAYSSQSATPPPPSRTHQDVFDSAFFNEVSIHSNQNCSYNRDEGFHENTRKVGSNFANSSQATTSRTRKSQAPKRLPSVSDSNEEESDFDKQVREALQETNRLLNLHKVKSSEPRGGAVTDVCNPQGSRISLDLRQLCDNTILHNDSSLPFKPTPSVPQYHQKQHDTEHYVRELKRKASQNLKVLSKKSHLSTSGNNVNAAVPTSLTFQPAPTLSPQLSPGSSFQAPVTYSVSTSEQPMEMFVKKEAVSNLLFTAPLSSCDVSPITIISPSYKTAMPDPSCQVLTSSSVMTPKPEEISLNSIVIKQDKTITSIPISSLNITTCNPVKPSHHKPSAKPLMVSQPATTTIVPNGNSAVFPSVILQNGLGISTQRACKENAGNNGVDVLSLDEVNKVTQNRVLKRQQRMMKNREAACQSRQRQKAYVKTLEQQMNECMDSNNQLRAVNASLLKRVAELEQENATLRAIAKPSITPQKKAACLLMFILFVGLNANSVNFLSNQGITNESPAEKLNYSKGEAGGWPPSIESGYHGRQLLSLEDQEIQLEKLKLSGAAKKETKQMLLTKSILGEHAFWLDDMVKDYMKKHFSRVLQLMHGTSSISLQRLLRRKLKEELGVLVPNTKRISYSPRLSEERPSYHDNTFPDEIMNPARLEDVKEPPPSPHVKMSSDSPCSHSSPRMAQLNETESLRISNNLAKWIEHHKVIQQNNKKTTSKKPHDNPSRNSKRKRRSSSSSGQHSKSSLPALYEKRDERMKRLLDAIDRKNDTVYMISFNKDHILLPAVMVNSSGFTKMSLVLPTAPPNDTFATSQQQTMIQINCEVLSTDYLRMDRDLLSSDRYQTRTHGHTGDVWVPQKEIGNPKLHAFHSTHHSNKRKSLTKAKKSRRVSTGDDIAIANDIDL